MQRAIEAPRDTTERIARLAAIAEKHGVTVDVLVPDREILLMTLSRAGTRATLEAKHLGESFNITLHENNPRGTSGTDFEGVIETFCRLVDAGDEPFGQTPPKPRG